MTHSSGIDFLLDEDAVAEILGVTVGCLHRWRQERIALKFVKLGNRVVRYRKEDVEEFIKAGIKSVKE
jgi:predicted DNA-binding transcriptional regulator AlpA